MAATVKSGWMAVAVKVAGVVAPVVPEREVEEKFIVVV